MRKRKVGNQPITHRWKHVVKQYDFMVNVDGSLHQGFTKPDDLTIITCSNYPEPGYFEKSLNFLGIDDYVVLSLPGGPWKSAYKIETIFNFLTSSLVEKTRYILFCDARDVIVRGSLHEVIRIFEAIGVDLLFNSTMYRGGLMCMEDVREWTKKVCKKRGRYVNAGVFIGDWDFTTVVFTEAMKYISSDSIVEKAYQNLGSGVKDTRLCEYLSDFPMNSTDQDILRYIHPQFYPRMDVDYYNEITYRN